MSGRSRRRLATGEILRAAAIAACVLAGSGARGAERFEPWERTFFDYLESKYGVDARGRFERLEVTLADHLDGSTMSRLNAVNDYFNELPWIADAEKWRQADYWATIDELIGTFGGDCEDMVLAKYTALRSLGVSDDNLALLYANVRGGEPHMVLTYFGSRGMDSLVLDNVNRRILPLAKRRDLRPVYSFNHQSLWRIDSRGARARPMPSARLEKWVQWKKSHAEMVHTVARYNAGRPILAPIVTE